MNRQNISSELGIILKNGINGTPKRTILKEIEMLKNRLDNSSFEDSINDQIKEINQLRKTEHDKKQERIKARAS